MEDANVAGRPVDIAGPYVERLSEPEATSIEEDDQGEIPQAGARAPASCEQAVDLVTGEDLMSIGDPDGNGR